MAKKKKAAKKHPKRNMAALSDDVRKNVRLMHQMADRLEKYQQDQDSVIHDTAYLESVFEGSVGLWISLRKYDAGNAAKLENMQGDMMVYASKRLAFEDAYNPSGEFYTRLSITAGRMIEQLRGVAQQLVESEELHAPPKETMKKPKLGDTAALIYENLLTLPEHRAMKLPDIVTWLWDEHQINLTDSTVHQKHLKQLEPWGLQHDKRIGYSINRDKKV